MRESTKARLIHDGKLLFVVILILIAYASVIIPAILYAGGADISILGPIIGSGVALVTGIFALLKDHIVDIINEPRLKIKIFPYDKRDCHATDFRNQNTGQIISKTHYFRVRVVNYGWSTAEDVEVTLEEVRKRTDERYVVDTDFMPLRLFWSHWKQARFELAIPSGAYRHCDLGFILDPSSKGFSLSSQENGNMLFWFDVFPRPNTGRTSLLPGEYEILVSAFGRNAKRASLKLELEWKGVWDDNIDKVLANGLAFS